MRTHSEIYRNIKMIVVLLIIAGFWSCQEVIRVDLNTAFPKLVIDAGVSDQPGPYRVVLSRTVSFDGNNSFPPVTGAVVVIADNAGNMDSLVEINPGTYQTTRLQGIPGRTYSLTVKSNNTVYSAISTMPSPVPIDTLIIKNRFGSKDKVLSVSFFDPVGITNYYRILEKITTALPAHGRIILPVLGTLMTDGLLDGTRINLLAFNQPDLNTGDTVLVSIQCIDKEVYNYFQSALQTGNMTTTVSNPVTNITNGALGFFSAYAVRYKTILVQ